MPAYHNGRADHSERCHIEFVPNFSGLWLRVHFAPCSEESVQKSSYFSPFPQKLAYLPSQGLNCRLARRQKQYCHGDTRGDTPHARRANYKGLKKCQVNGEQGTT